MHLDESGRGNFIAVGGFICAADDVLPIADAWEAMRLAMGIGPDEPLKWNFGQNNATRRRLDEAGWVNQERRRLILDTIRELPVTLLADVIYDDRDLNRPPLDFYKEALDWLLLRFRNFVTDLNPRPTGPHVVVLDQPSPAPEARTNDPRFAWLAERRVIWYRVYERAYKEGWHFPWARFDVVQTLRQDGFYPSCLVSHAKFNPLLEVADAVAGLALDFAFYNIRNAGADGRLPRVEWQDEQFIKVVRKFRAKWNGDVLKYGFALFPRTTPAFANFGEWVTYLSTNDDFAALRGEA
jgi:hypothetical protein